MGSWSALSTAPAYFDMATLLTSLALEAARASTGRGSRKRSQQAWSIITRERCLRFPWLAFLSRHAVDRQVARVMCAPTEAQAQSQAGRLALAAAPSCMQWRRSTGPSGCAPTSSRHLALRYGRLSGGSAASEAETSAIQREGAGVQPVFLGCGAGAAALRGCSWRECRTRPRFCCCRRRRRWQKRRAEQGVVMALAPSPEVRTPLGHAPTWSQS